MTEDQLAKIDNAARDRLNKIRQTDVYQKNLKKYLYSNRNPILKEEVRKKALDAMKKKGYKHLAGGNGMGPTLSQKLLAHALGWPMEHAVGVRPIKKGYPRSFKIDIANPKMKIAIEVDGLSHRTKKVMIADQKKTDYLESKGWKVIRFQNKEVLKDLNTVVQKIYLYIT
ncbi:MAG: DUF559 domain-containing protein [Sedimentisphaerales bacterium]